MRKMKIGIIGYGSMGKMMLEKISQSKNASEIELYIANRTQEKIAHLAGTYRVCTSNAELAASTDIIFLCVRPTDMRAILEEIKGSLGGASFLVSLNGSITFEQLETVCCNKIAKVIPSVTAEVNQSQTLVCYNEMVGESEKEYLAELLRCMGNVIELPEKEIGIGSELVSCMPGFIAAIFQEICISAKRHIELAEAEIVQMVLHTMIGTGELMVVNQYSFDNVISRVATKGGITEEGTRVIQEHFPEVANELFDKTLEKRRITTMNAQNMFDA